MSQNQVAAEISKNILTASENSKVSFSEKYKSLGEEEAAEMLRLNTQRIENNNLSKWLMIGYCDSASGNGEAYLSPDMSEYFKIILFDGRKTKTNEGYWFSTEQELFDFINRWAHRSIQNGERKKALLDVDLRELEIVNRGDIFEMRFGYKNSFVSFYEVVEIKGKKTIDLRRLNTLSEMNNDSEKPPKLTPIKSSFTEDSALSCRIYISNHNDVNQKIYVKIPASGKKAYLING